MKKRILAVMLSLVMLLTAGVPTVVRAENSVNTLNGVQIPFSQWSGAGDGVWAETDGILSTTGLSEFGLLRLEANLGNAYTIDFDVKQEDLTSGWNTIQLGFEVNAGENNTQSGLTLDLHNAGVARVISFKDSGGSGLGSYAEPYGGNAGYAPTTDWFHVRIVRYGNDFTVSTEVGGTISFTTDAFNGGHLVLGAVGSRKVSYKNIAISTQTYQTPSVNTLNGVEIPFSKWTAAGDGAWTQEKGILAPTGTSEFGLLRLEEDLGEAYTIDFDVKQDATGNGWDTIQFGFEVNAGENNTQSGYTLDLHNAGVARVISFKDSGASGLGSYAEPYGGNAGYAPTTEWFHVQIVRNGKDFTVTTENSGTITFTSDAFDGGHLVLGAVGSRTVSYRNITITTKSYEAPPVNTLNGVEIPFSKWTAAGDGAWVQTDGVLAPEGLSEFGLLRLEEDLGEAYTIDFDVKQDATGNGWDTIQFGFEVNPGENNTQSGYTLDLHNAGFARVISFKDSGGSGLGSYAEPYGGNAAYTPTTEWFHVQIVRNGKDFTVTTENSGTITFTSDAFDGGHLVLGAVGSRKVSYRNVVITTGTVTPSEPDPEVCATTFNGEPLSFTNWSNAAFSSWTQEDGVLRADEKVDFALLRLEKDLGENYTVDMDLKQEDAYSGWNTIQLGFEVNAGENNTQSGLTLDLHNSGFARIISFKDSNSGGLGSYNNPYGGNTNFSGTTEWIHVRIARSGNKFKVTINDGTEKSLVFTTDQFNGGHLVIGSVGLRNVIYKNIVINTDVKDVDVSGNTDGKGPDVITQDRAVYQEKEGGVNTFNGEVIPAGHWSNAGFTPWQEINGILSPVKITEFGLWRYDRDLGDTYTIELDVKQPDVSSGWNTIQLGFDVKAGENFTQSGLTLDLHNAGIARVIDFTNRENKSVRFGSYDSPWGGSVDYSCTTQWIHIKIEKLKSYYTVTINDGTEKVIRFETEDYSGGHLVIGSVGYRDIIYKNVTITDTVTAMAPADPTYPEEIGSITYTYQGNAFGEWVPTNADVWTQEDSKLTQTAPEGEQTVWFNSEPLRNFKLFLNYDVLSEQEGRFGISFRKKTGEASYQGLGYSLIFEIGEEGNTLTFADYTASGAAALDGMPHSFELAGNVTVTASGNEFCVWLDDELIINLNSNAYAYGCISLFTENSSVEFSDISITADALLSDPAWVILDAFRSGEPLTAEHQQAFEALDAMQQSMMPEEVKQALEAVSTEETVPADDVQETPVPGNGFVIPVICGAVLLLCAAMVIVLVIRKKRAAK